MDKKWIILLFGLAVLVTIGILLYPEKKEKQKSVSKIDKDEMPVFRDKGYSDTIYPDAPSPFTEDAKLEDEAVFLWPSTLQSVKDEKHKEKVREEWKAFASVHPNNIYLLNEYKPALTKEQEEKIIAEMNTFTEVESFFARNVASSKYAAVGVEPQTSNTPGVTPQAQKVYFDYKIKELESRIQLIEYAKENKGLSLEQESMAEKEIAAWKKEIEKLKEVAKTIPNI